jgi:cytoskeletal protein CcmA (bactofilin family)
MEQMRRHDLNLSGIGSASGGTYEDVRVQGIGKIHGDIDCVRCKVEGIVNVCGGIKAQTVHIQGKGNVEGNVAAGEVKIEGDITVAGNCEAESFDAAGGFVVNGLVSADQVSIRLYGSAKVRDIGGESIRVMKGHRFGLFSRFKKLSAETVEGDDVYLEYTKAKVVRGNRVHIGPGCEIDLVEYRGEFRQDEDARVKEHNKI